MADENTSKKAGGVDEKNAGYDASRSQSISAEGTDVEWLDEEEKRARRK